MGPIPGGYFQRLQRGRRTPAPLFAGLGALLLIYLGTLIVRGPDTSWPLVDDWGVAAFELVLGVLCIARGWVHPAGRRIPFVLGAALVSWAIGDAVLAAESSGGASPDTPSLADLFYLGFYPIAYVAILMLIRTEVRKFLTLSWLDGAVAGLGAAALCAAFAFNTIMQTTGDSPLAVATNLAYPAGDLLLFALVVAGTTVLPGRLRAPWLLLAGGCAINGIGDTFNLFHLTGTASKFGAVFDGVAWPTAVLLISASVWLPRGYRRRSTEESTAGFALPGLAAFSALAVLCAGTVHRIDSVALGLAAATLITVGVRLTLSVTRLKAITEERHHQAITDDLTGMANRRRLFHLLDGFFTHHDDDVQPPDAGLAFLYIDLDRFKEVNDAFGHAAGDELLKQLAPRLRTVLRNGDVLARIGGDELAVVLMDTDPAAATAVAERLAAKMKEPFIIGAVKVSVSASIGIALAPGDATASADLVRCADLAMYRAKVAAAPYRLYQHDLDDGGNRLQLVQELRVAIENRELTLNYQPLVDLHSGRVRAVEALVRWQHERLGMVPPLDFLPLAEDAGLMPALTEFVLNEALKQCAVWRGGGHDLAVSVNISASNLLASGFVDVVRTSLSAHQVPAPALILEITETTVLSDFEACRRAIEHLRDLGLDVSIDDFGAGFTSLAYLGNLAVREMKLDRSFITHLATGGDARDLALVQATIELGHALGLRVVAEGIEDRGTLDLLVRAGCDLAQGYFISRPLPAASLTLDVEHAAPEAIPQLRAS